MPVIVKRLLWYAVIAAALALSFAAYLQPQFMVDLGNRIMLCT
jgi:hypothetical protein